MSQSALEQNVPVLDLDPYSEEFLLNPYPFHKQLREAGPVVWIPKYGVRAMARYTEVKSALQDWETFCSSRGVGLSDFKKEEPWRPPSILLEVDPPFHTRTRGVVSKILSRPALEALRDEFTRKAEELVERLIAKGTEIDAFSEIAKAFPLKVFPDAVGVTPEGRHNLLPYGDMAFNAFGPRNERLAAAMQEAGKVVAWITAQCQRDALTKDGLGAKIYEEADAGAVSHGEAGLLVRSLLTAGLDTTIFGIGNALHLFATNPDQWALLREDDSLIQQAFDEILRYASPAQTFYRTTTKDAEIGGVTIPEGEKVLLFLAAANRDPDQWENAETFDIQRTAGGHVGFGFGIHVCVGQMLARLETEIILKALAKRVERFELIGEPQWWLNNTLRGLASLPMRLHLAEPATSAAVSDTDLAQPDAEGLFTVTVAAKTHETADICSFEFASADSKALPAIEPGAHIDVHLGNDLIRQYSICNRPDQQGVYRIGVLRKTEGRGGSEWIHSMLRQGDTIRISQPRNLFPLSNSSKPRLLIAGGIGITPILSMAYELEQREIPFQMHYCTRNAERAAFKSEIERSQFAGKVALHHDETSRLDIAALLDLTTKDAEIYVCGPEGFLEAVLDTARAKGWSEEDLHCEYFAASSTARDSDEAFEVEIRSTGQVIIVPADSTVMVELEKQGIDLPKSCEQGVCGSCVTGVVTGEPDHRDHFLTPAERNQNDKFTPCCSRAKSERLVLDL